MREVGDGGDGGEVALRVIDAGLADDSGSGTAEDGAGVIAPYGRRPRLAGHEGTGQCSELGKELVRGSAAKPACAVDGGLQRVPPVRLARVGEVEMVDVVAATSRIAREQGVALALRVQDDGIGAAGHHVGDRGEKARDGLAGTR